MWIFETCHRQELRCSSREWSQNLWDVDNRTPVIPSLYLAFVLLRKARQYFLRPCPNNLFVTQWPKRGYLGQSKPPPHQKKLISLHQMSSKVVCINIFIICLQTVFVGLVNCWLSRQPLEDQLIVSKSQKTHIFGTAGRSCPEFVVN